MLQSRLKTDVTLPCLSASSWTSRWRALAAIFMAKMGDPGTSAWTCLKPTTASSTLATLRIPLPPPPHEALIMTGNPIWVQLRTASSTVPMQASA